MIKRIAAALLCAACLAAMPLCVCAEDSMQVLTKEYVLNMTETEGAITASPNTAAFWEYPLLRAGEQFHVEGTLVIRNDSAITASMVMEPVALPYGDEAKLTYLDNVMLTVKEGDTVLFDNSYTHINDPQGGLSLIFNDMAPGESHTYTITMYCKYTYDGDVYADAVPMSWRFSAKAQNTPEEGAVGTPMWLLIIAAWVGVTAVAVAAVAMVNIVINKKSQKEEKTVDNAEEL